MNTQYTFLYTLFISSVAAIGGFLFGYDSAVINGAISALQETFQSSAATSGFSVASMLLGCAVGAIFAGNLADHYGRRPIMLITGILFLISAIGSGIAGGVFSFVIYRLIGGLAVGAASVIAPTYISEVAPEHVRGRLASLQQLAIVVGIFSAFLVNYGIANAAGGSNQVLWMNFKAWQWMFWSEAVPSIFFILFVFLIPESPRFLVAIKRDDEAKNVLSKLGSAEHVIITLRKIKESLSHEHKPHFSDVLSRGKILPIVWIGIALSVFQQFVGINVVFYYGSVLWKSAGFDESKALLINVLSGTINIGSTIVAMSVIDKLGRKPLLVMGSVGMTLTLGALTVIFSMGTSVGGVLQLTSGEAIAALVAAHLYIFCFGVSWGPVVWVLLGEIFNNRIRGAAISVAASAQWIANFAITMTFPMILGSFGLFAAYGMYTFFALLSIFFVVAKVKETKGKRLEDME